MTSKGKLLLSKLPLYLEISLIFKNYARLGVVCLFGKRTPSELQMLYSEWAVGVISRKWTGAQTTSAQVWKDTFNCEGRDMGGLTG